VGNIQSRDLRRLDFTYTPQEEPAVLVRRHAVLISLDPLRVIVMADRIVGFMPDGADSLLQTLYMNMQACHLKRGGYNSLLALSSLLSSKSLCVIGNMFMSLLSNSLFPSLLCFLFSLLSLIMHG
jgi:hypothetical protein